MQSTINYKKEHDKVLLYAVDKLPGSLCDELISFIHKNNLYVINEIRIKRDSFATLIVSVSSAALTAITPKLRMILIHNSTDNIFFII